MNERSDPGRASWWCGLAFGGSLLAVIGAVGAVGYCVSRPASAPAEEVEWRNERAVSPDELDRELIDSHLAHRPGECKQCDWHRDWEARPPIGPAD